MNGLITYMTVLMLSSYIFTKLMCILTDNSKTITVRITAFLSLGVVGMTVFCVILTFIQVLLKLSETFV